MHRGKGTGMKVNQRRQHSVGKWIVAGLAFLLVMTLTFADVSGVNIPGKKAGGGSTNADPKAGATSNYEGPSNQAKPDPNPSPVPEPATMILMAVGLGAAAVLSRTRKKA